MIPKEGRPYILDAALDHFRRSEALLLGKSRTKGRIYPMLMSEDCALHNFINDEDAEWLFDKLVEEGCFIKHEDPFADTFYEYSERLNSFYQGRYSDTESPLAKWQMHGKEWMDTALTRIFSEDARDIGLNPSPSPIEASIPASNRTVTLNDNQQTEAIKTLEEVIQEFQKDHNFGNEWVAEKGALLKALENGKEYLEAKTLDVRIGTMMIIEPLQAIADKYKEAAINGTFSALVQKALEYFINSIAG